MVHHNIRILKTSSNWKLLSVHAEGVTSIHLTGELNKPMMTITEQRLTLVNETEMKTKVIIPRTMRGQFLYGIFQGEILSNEL